MNIFIVLFILLINVVNIFAMYKLLGNDIGKKEKVIFIAVGVAVMYMIVSAVYWLSSIGMNEKAADAGRDFITFTFVPVNGLCVLTFLSSSYKKYKAGRLKANILRNRCVALIGVLIILLIVEFFYFKNIQNNALEMLNNNLNNETNTMQTENNNTVENNVTESNNIVNNAVSNDTEANTTENSETDNNTELNGAQNGNANNTEEQNGSTIEDAEINSTANATVSNVQD